MSILLAMAVLALAACSGSSGTSTTQSKTKPVLRIGLSGFGYLDPAKDSNSGTFKDISYAPLIHIKPDGTFAPGLATSWHYLDTGGQANTNFELTLRTDAKFSDGEPVTAQAVKGWLDYFVAAHGPFSTQMGPNPTFEAVGSSTVRIHLTQPHPNLMRLLSEVDNWSWVAAPQAVANPALFATNTYGAGPYMMDGSRSVTGDHFTFVPNPYYYDKSAIKFSEVDVKVITTPSTMLQAMQSGQLDVAYGEESTVAAAASSGLGVLSTLAFNLSIFIADYNGTTMKALGDVRVRRAMNYAIDRKTIAKGLFGDHAVPTSQLLTTDASESKYENYYPYDPAKAKALLAEAGYPDGFTVKLIDSGPGAANGDLLYQAAAKYLDAVGIHLDIHTSGATLFQDIATKSYPLIAFSQGVQPTFILYPVIAPGASLSPFNATDPMLQQLYLAGLASANPSVSWTKLYERVVEQAYYVTLLCYQFHYYVSKSIGGVTTSQKRVAFILPQEWYPK